MQTKFQQAKELVVKGKHKKALAILKKINQKDYESSFEVLELEIGCLFIEKKFQLAYVKNQELLKQATSDIQRFSSLRSLAAVSERLGKQEESLHCLKEIMKIDSSLKTAEQRFSLIMLAFKAGDFESVSKYAPLLSNHSKYAVETLLLLGNSAINSNNHEDALVYFSRLMGEMHVEGRFEIEQKNIISLFNGLHIIKAYTKEKELLNFIAPKFQHEDWFNVVQQRLLNVLSKPNTKGGKLKSAAKKTQEVSTIPVNKGVSGNTAETVKVIKKLQTEMVAMGASFHQDLSIVEHNGEISVTFAKANEQNEVLMHVPIRCMPLVNDYQFSMDKNGLLITKAKKNMMNPDAHKLMLLLTQMFNACNKLKNWKESYPLFQLCGFTNITRKLLQAKSNAAGYAKYIPDSEGQISDRVLIDSFLGSRVLTFDYETLRKNKIKTKKKLEAGFMPIIELINHKMGAGTFETLPNRASMRTLSGIGPAGREVFVQYNLDDPVITFFTYGFVDTSAEWIYSVPLLLKTTTQLNLEISTQVERANTDNIPEHLVVLAEFMPADICRQKNTIQVSKLIIPGAKHSHSLRAVLVYLLKRIDSEGTYNNPDRLDKEVDFIERQIIDQNKAYWESLEDLIVIQQQSNNPLPSLVAEPLKDLCELCINHIKRYDSQTGFILKS